MGPTARLETLPRDTRTPYPRPGWRGRAFGLVVEAPSPLAGLASTRAAGGRRVGLELLPPDELEARWRPAEAVRVFRQPLADGQPALALERHEALGYKLIAYGYGSWLVSSDGASIQVAPPRSLAPWLWQRFLVSQVLPFAALLQGLEVFHASAVAIGDRLIAIVGASGAGKTSVALNLVLSGAGFFTDDVLALEAAGSGVICHPGAAAANVRDAELRRKVELVGAPVREILGRGTHSVRVRFERDERELPLAAVYFLDRGGADGDVRFEATSDPRLLLAGTFNFAIRTPARLEAQLDSCARIASSAAIFRVLSPLSITAAELAPAIERHAGAVLARGHHS